MYNCSKIPLTPFKKGELRTIIFENRSISMYIVQTGELLRFLSGRATDYDGIIMP